MQVILKFSAPIRGEHHEDVHNVFPILRCYALHDVAQRFPVLHYLNHIPRQSYLNTMQLQFHLLTAFVAILTPVASFAMSTSTPNSTETSPVTRIATFRFLPNVTAEQKGDRASAFLALYAEHPELLVEGPKGGKPLNTPLNLTNVKRESVWDMGFVVVFKVWS